MHENQPLVSLFCVAHHKLRNFTPLFNSIQHKNKHGTFLHILSSLTYSYLSIFIPNNCMATRKNLTIKDEIAGSRFTLCNGSPNLDRLFQSDLPLLERMRVGPSTKHCIGHVFSTVLQLLRKCSLSQHLSVTLISCSVGSYYTFDSCKHDCCVKFIGVMRLPPFLPFVFSIRFQHCTKTKQSSSAEFVNFPPPRHHKRTTSCSCTRRETTLPTKGGS